MLPMMGTPNRGIPRRLLPASVIAALWLLMAALPPAVQGLQNLELKFSDGIPGFYEPLIASEILNNNIPDQIMRHYREKKYRNAIVDLRRLKKLQLPDGRLDVYTFLEGECYLQLGLFEFASDNYTEIIDYFPESKLQVESVFRMVQIADKNRSDSLVARFHNRLKTLAPQNILVSASTYLLAKSMYLSGKFKSARKEIENIRRDSPYFFSGKFLLVLCQIQENRYDEALKSLTSIIEESENADMQNEAHFTMGLILEKQGKPPEALRSYDKVSKKSDRFSLATLKKALIHLKEKDFKKVVKITRPVLDKPNYFFEASFVLLDTYWTLKDSLNAGIIRNKLSIQAKLTRTMIVLEEEKIFLQDLNRNVSAQGNMTSDPQYKSFEKRANARISAIDKKLTELKKILQEYLPPDQEIVVSGIREQKLMQIYELRLKLLEEEIARKQQSLRQDTSTAPKSRLNAAEEISRLQQERQDAEHIVDELTQLNQNIIEAQSESADLQPKFIDVGMIMYRKLKENYQESNQKIREYSERLFRLEEEKNRRKTSNSR